MNKGTILCIDDDENLQMVISSYLETDGYKTLSAFNVESALEKADIKNLDVILLDLVLPDGEGLTLIPQLRTKSKAGIIVVSGKSDTTEKIVCLEMGADDYITKPFEMRELAARIKAVIRRTEPSNDSEANGNDSNEDEVTQIRFEGGWVLDRSQYQLYNKDGVSADLTTGEFKLLEALLMAPNKALSRERLFSLTRDGDYDVYDRAIDIQIARIRKKINDDTKSPALIKTVRGIGYMFVGKIDKDK